MTEPKEVRELQVGDTAYPVLRHLTLPVVAITSSANGRPNGMIVNSAQRASLVPTRPRISMYISKPNFTHDLIYASGVFGIHLLRRDQWDLIWHLGLQSGRDVPKLSSLETRTGETGCPMLVDVAAAFECRVINAMDEGSATFFLGEVVTVRQHGAAEVMTSEHFRQYMPADKKRIYESRLAHAMEYLEPLSRHIDPAKRWPGPTANP
jgi:flavin reductase (DIM6/NTAB) family NADH-FMN oxidoreductase RutF